MIARFRCGCLITPENTKPIHGGKHTTCRACFQAYDRQYRADRRAREKAQ